MTIDAHRYRTICDTRTVAKQVYGRTPPIQCKHSIKKAIFLDGLNEKFLRIKLFITDKTLPLLVNVISF